MAVRLGGTGRWGDGTDGGGRWGVAQTEAFTTQLCEGDRLGVVRARKAHAGLDLRFQSLQTLESFEPSPVIF